MSPKSPTVVALSGAHVLVTGANGFVGPHLARSLVARGARVSGAGLGAAPPTHDLEEWTTVDLADRPGLDQLLRARPPRVVVHLAGQSSAAHSFVAPLETFEANVLGTWNLLDAVSHAAPTARVIVVGTSEVYGSITPGTRADENHPMRPVSPYALSKSVVDTTAAAFGLASRLDVVRARPFGHAGPGQTARFMLPGFAEQIAAIECGRAERVLRVGNLEVTRDLTDVRDIAEGYCALIERGRSGEVYNLCRGTGVVLSQLAASLASMAKVDVRIQVDPARLRPADVPYLVGDPTRAGRDVGWAATITFESTLRDVLQEWRGLASGQG
ncbi:MAG: GDP-mannose 4,6-dehydratase [Candidatus Eisenbacteria bacterium]